EGVYGAADNFSIIGGFTHAHNFKQFSVYAGVEAALLYDVVDVRLPANVHRFAYPQVCHNSRSAQPATVGDHAARPPHANLPHGNFTAGATQFSIDLGFPIRYPFTPEIAVVALQTLIGIDFNGSTRGNPMTATAMGRPVYCSGVTTDMNGDPLAADPANCIE